MSSMPIYRFVTRSQILAGCAQLTDSVITQAILNRALNPVIEATGLERFRGDEVEAYLAGNGFEHSINLRHGLTL